MHAIPVGIDHDGSPIFRNPEAIEGLIENSDPNINSIYSLFM